MYFRAFLQGISFLETSRHPARCTLKSLDSHCYPKINEGIAKSSLESHDLRRNLRIHEEIPRFTVELSQNPHWNLKIPTVFQGFILKFQNPYWNTRIYTGIEGFTQEFLD